MTHALIKLNKEKQIDCLLKKNDRLKINFLVIWRHVAVIMPGSQYCGLPPAPPLQQHRRTH